MNFVYEIENTLSSKLCKDIINRFEGDDRKQIGRTGAGVQKDVKRSTDLFITGLDNWKDIDDVLFKKLNVYIKLYINYLLRTEYYNVNAGAIANTLSNVKDTGYQIQRIQKGEFYKWHHDFSNTQKRILVFIWYLNDVLEEHGGATQFHFGSCKKIQPKEGKLILFPAQWPWLHRGCTVTGDTTKYIITGFILINDD